MKRTLWLLAAVVAASFGFWSLYVASKYQSLCEISVFSASTSELRRCEERMAELEGR